MKRITLALSLLVIGLPMIAQDTVQKDKYRRSSLYTMMVLDTNVKGSTGDNDEEKAAVVEKMPQLYAATPMPDKYDDHNLTTRSITLADLPEVTVEKTESATDKLGISNPVEFLGIGGGKSDEEIVASLQQYFKDNHTANLLVCKWYNAKDDKYDNGTHFSPDFTLQDRALNAVTEDEKRQMMAMSSSDQARLRSNTATDLLNKTFIMVNLFTYKSAEEIKDLVTTGMMAAAGSKVNNPLGKKAVEAGIASALSPVKGYMCCYKTYLFRLNYNDEKFNNECINMTPLSAFVNSDSFTIDYVGKTSGWKPVVSAKGGNEGETTRLLTLITERTIDDSIVKLQKEYDDFKTLATLHPGADGKSLIAYIGTKEGLKGGESFEVLEKQMDEEGNISYKSIGSVQAVKGKIWNNVAGANDTNLQELEGTKADSYSDQFTVIKGDPKKFAGLLIRQKK